MLFRRSDGKAPPHADVPAATTAAVWGEWHLIGLLLIALLMLVLALVPFPLPRFEMWLVLLLQLTLFAFIAGHSITKLWYGVLVGHRNTVSLSRFQLLVWTLVILSGLMTAVIANIQMGATEPLHLTIPVELWLMMGISLTSGVGAPLLMPKPVTPTQNTAQTAETPLPNSVVTHTSPCDAHWSDLFRGDRIETVGQLDLNKLQMLFFTLILVLAYASTLAQLFRAESGKIVALPGLDPGMMVLLGISHAGFLMNKVLPPNKTNTP